VPDVAVIGGGPAGLAAAEKIAAAGHRITVYDRMPSLGRKFLYAGRGGLNLTHVEPFDAFLSRYGAARESLAPALHAFGPEAVRAFTEGLGVETFVGSSGRVFPVAMKASPMLRAWLRRLGDAGVRFAPRHRWIGFDAGGLVFDTPDGRVEVAPDAIVLALGGGSWPHLGSDGAWMPILGRAGVATHPLRPANMGFEAGWSDIFAARFAGTPVKPVVAEFEGIRRRGEFVATASGIEGGLVYALSAPLRDRIAADGSATLFLDLLPDREASRLAGDLSRPQGRHSLTDHIRRTTGLTGVKAALLRELGGRDLLADPAHLAGLIKRLPLRLLAPSPLEDAISTAGGIAFEALDPAFMLRGQPGVFACGEMLDWEAPTGGYLLTACLATGRAAGDRVVAWLARAESRAKE
jgi:uncharacterized flavoprotein (TIGR03862 family)